MGNSMIIKTAIALVLTASLAGGAVYYGTQDGVANGEVALDEHPHKKLETSTDDDGVENEDVQASDTEGMEEASVSTIDRLLNRDISSEADEISEVEEDTEIETTTTKTTITETVETDEDVQTFESIDAQESIQSNSSVALSENNFVDLNDKEEFIDLVLKKIEKIESSEIKDQAQFDLITYALKNQMYSRAADSIMKIENPSFRDKARGEYALGLVENNQVQAAFEVLEDVETDELRDVLKLKTIQAMIGYQSEQ